MYYDDIVYSDCTNMVYYLGLVMLVSCCYKMSMSYGGLNYRLSLIYQLLSYYRLSGIPVYRLPVCYHCSCFGIMSLLAMISVTLRLLHRSQPSRNQNRDSNCQKGPRDFEAAKGGTVSTLSPAPPPGRDI